MLPVNRITPAVLVLALGVSGCTFGLSVPDTIDFLSKEPAEEADQNLILNHIKCQLHLGVQNTLYDPRFYPPTPTTGKSVDWLLQWGAKVSYVLTVDEKASLNPGATITEPFHKAGTSFSVGGGIQSSAESQTKRTGAITYAFADLLKEKPTSCSDVHGILIYGDLGIPKFISDEAFLTRVPGTVPTIPRSLNSPKPQTLTAASEEITFTVIYGGSVTPSWKFVRLAIDPSSSLFSDTRTKTQYVSVTLGPVQQPANNATAAQLSPEAQSIDATNLNSHAITSAPPSH